MYLLEFVNNMKLILFKKKCPTTIYFCNSNLVIQMRKNTCMLTNGNSLFSQICDKTTNTFIRRLSFFNWFDNNSFISVKMYVWKLLIYETTWYFTLILEKYMIENLSWHKTSFIMTCLNNEILLDSNQFKMEMRSI